MCTHIGCALCCVVFVKCVCVCVWCVGIGCRIEDNGCEGSDR